MKMTNRNEYLFQLLFARGWKCVEREGGTVIEPPYGYLHMDFPEGWPGGLENFRSVVAQRLETIQTRNDLRCYTYESQRDEMLKDHLDAIEAIDLVISRFPSIDDNAASTESEEGYRQE